MSEPESFEGRGFAESEEQLHEVAAAEVGSSDFGDPSYREGLGVLLRAYDAEARLNAYGRSATFQMVLDQLKKRLRGEALWKDLVADPPPEIRRPIVILGLVRTGSTALHYLMGQDPGLQSLQYWLASNPQPRPPRNHWEANPDFQASTAEIDGMYEADPSLKSIHFMMPDGPEECRHLLSQCFTDDGFEVNASIPSYSEWYEQAPMRASYQRHQRLIQLIGSNDSEKRWLLKYPVHVRHMEALLEQYPDACVVWTHRDPAQVMPSFCSLIAGFRAIYEDDTDPKQMSERQLELWAGSVERGLACRRSRDPAQFYDLYFSDFVADPISSVRRIYAHFDQELSEEGERRLIGWQQENPQHKHGRHEYDDDIGIDRSMIWKRFEAYMDSFDLRPE